MTDLLNDIELTIKVTVIDQAGGKTVTAELSADAQMSHLIPALVVKMQLPANVQYSIQHKQSGKLLQSSDTLVGAYVKEGDTIQLISNASNKIKVIVTDQAGGKTVAAELPGDAQMSRLIPALVTKMALPSNAQYGAQHKQSGKQLQPSDTLESAGIKEGDTIRLLNNVTAGGPSIPIRTFRDIQLFEAILSNRFIEQQRGLKQIFNRPHLLGVFLYTDDDISLATYIRERMESLSRMSSDRFLFFVIERLAPELVANLRKDFGDLFGVYAEQVWKRLGGDSARPYPKNEAYEIGRRFGVKPGQFPCIVLFTDLTSKDILVIEINDFIDKHSEKINDEYTRFFRVLFSQIESGMTQEYPLSYLGKSLLSARVKRSVGGYTGEQAKLTISVVEVIASIVKLFA